MKNLAFIICVVASLSFTNLTTVEDPVSWEFDTETIDGSTYLVIKADIAAGWKMYGAFPTAGYDFEPCNGDLGPVCLEVGIVTGEDLLMGELEGDKVAKKSYDSVFQGELTYYTGEVVLRQKIKNASGEKIEGYVFYMTCNDAKCIPPKEVNFEVTL